VILGYGAPWIGNLTQIYFPSAIQMVDGYPAGEHLETVSCVAFSSPQQQQARLEAMRQGIAGMDGSKKSSRLANRLPSVARKPHAKKWARNGLRIGVRWERVTSDSMLILYCLDCF